MRVLAGLAVAVVGCQRPQPPTTTLVANQAPLFGGSVVSDGALDEPGWQQALRSGPFLNPQGQPAVPHSELRLAVTDRDLLLGLYAADEDIGPSDAFTVRVQKLPDGAIHQVELTATATLTAAEVGSPGWQSGARFGVDVDGTVGQPDDFDEEWVAELGLPLRRLALTAGDVLRVTVNRCDMPKRSRRRCGQWQGDVTLPP